MPTNKPPPLLHHINELKKEIKALRGDIIYIKDFIQRYEEKQKLKQKDMVVVEEDDGDTIETLAHSPPENQGWFWN